MLFLFFSSFAQMYIMTLLSITDFLKSKLLTYGIVYGILCLTPSFSGVMRLFLYSAQSAGTPFPVCVSAGPSDVLRKVHGVGNDSKVGFRGSCETLDCRSD